MAVELGRDIGSSVGNGAAGPSSMTDLIGGRIDEMRVGIGAIGGRLPALVASIEAVVGGC